jgi:hypothetical protein
MTKKEIRVSLCGGDKCCPEVVVDTKAHAVKIGEEGNLVRLDKRAWNELVAKIKSGKLSSL